MKRALITGAAGQIGTELTANLIDRYGPGQVMATDIRAPSDWAARHEARQLDCLNLDALRTAVADFRPTDIFHLAAILSAAAEADPLAAYRLNMNGLVNVLQIACEAGCSVFTPSSIAVFGPGTPRDPAPQSGVQRPATMYGVTKVAGELLCDYYHARYGVDARGLRFPGLVSHTAPPGGGTTDYAVEIFHGAVERGRYRCFLRPDTRMDMVYMPDAIRAIVEVMEAPAATLVHRNAFNISAMHFTPAELAGEIRRHIPTFEIDYAPDPLRQAIADSWPARLDDSAARGQWGWQPRYGMQDMVRDMLDGVRARHRAQARQPADARGVRASTTD